MLLCDSIAHWVCHRDSPERIGLPREIISTSVYRTDMRRLARVDRRMTPAKRFLLEDQVVEAITKALVVRPSALHELLGGLRLAWPALWCEFREAPRQRILAEGGHLIQNSKATPQRIGFLLETAETGRQAVATFCWHHLDENGLPMPAVCPLVLSLDLDMLAVPAADPEMVETDIGRRFKDDPVELGALASLENAVAVLQADDAGPSLQALDQTLGFGTSVIAVQSARDDLRGEVLFLMAVILMLHAEGDIGRRTVVRAKLNKSRIKRGEAPLRDHVMLHLVDPPAPRQANGNPPGGAQRRAAHIVKGHFLRSHGKVVWRQAHWRGFGPRRGKTVKVV